MRIFILMIDCVRLEDTAFLAFALFFVPREAMFLLILVF